MTGPLRLDLRVPADPLRRADPVPVVVVLTNAGSSPVLVNRRMAPGYVDSISREVYFDMDMDTAGDGGDGDGGYGGGGYGQRKYERELPAAADFGPLGAGEQIRAEIDLLGWYRLRAPGTYRVRAHYRCDEELAEPPAGTFAGVVDSPVMTVVVI
ncbi:MAG TPA: hypothetical protein VIU11_17800 [Nakamurella sp.]